MIPARALVSLALGAALAGLSLRLTACSVEVVPPVDPPPGTAQGCVVLGAGGGAAGADPDAGSDPDAGCPPPMLP